MPPGRKEADKGGRQKGGAWTTGQGVMGKKGACVKKEKVQKLASKETRERKRGGVPEDKIANTQSEPKQKKTAGAGANRRGVRSTTA